MTDFVGFRVCRGIDDKATRANLLKEWHRYWGKRTTKTIWLTTPADGYNPLAYQRASKLENVKLSGDDLLLEFV